MPRPNAVWNEENSHENAEGHSEGGARGQFLVTL